VAAESAMVDKVHRGEVSVHSGMLSLKGSVDACRQDATQHGKQPA